jgi:hypothetical protein
MSAVVIGSFAPDFGYFIPFSHRDSYGHTLSGMFLQDLPLGLAVLWLFHGYVREPLASCLPKGARERLHFGTYDLPENLFSRLAVISLSILTGVATHILWDSFTHSNYLLYDHWQFLRTIVLIPLFGPRPIYGILQYISSALGLVLILVWYIHWYRNTTPVRQKDGRLTKDRVAIACLLLVAVICAFVSAAAEGIPHGVGGSQRFITDLAITGITAFWIGLVIYSVARDIFRKIKHE